MTPRKVLIVEDDAALRRGLKDNFEAEGYQVRTAEDGEKGLDALLRDPPDLALLDVKLPKINGLEICRLARSRRLKTPILMLSARCCVDDVLRGLAVGADEYMTKPFGLHELLTRAQRLSRRSALGGARPSPARDGGVGTAAAAGAAVPGISRDECSGKKGNQFPLTPALSLREREPGNPSLENTGRARSADGLATILPLPKGEGRGALPLKLGDIVFACIHNMLINNDLGCTFALVPPLTWGCKRLSTTFPIISPRSSKLCAPSCATRTSWLATECDLKISPANAN